MADMDRRVRLTLLYDLYGPLLTEHRRELLRLYCEEDLSLQEIGDQAGITRQGACDAVGRAERQLEEYERLLGFLGRTQDAARIAERGLAALAGCEGASAEAARAALQSILHLQR